MNETTQKEAAAAASAPPTVSHMLGEMTWLLTQSPLHRGLSIGDIEWPTLFFLIGLFVMVGALEETGALREVADGIASVTGGDRVAELIWLVDLIAPFANGENKHREIMIADLISGPLSGKAFKFHQTDPRTGKRTVQTVDGDAGEKLKVAIEASLTSKQ